MDKKSFIKWKQRDIHEKREQLKYNLTRLEANNEVNTELIPRLRRLLAAAEKSPGEFLFSIDLGVKTAAGESTKQKPVFNTAAPSYNEMIGNLLEQIVAKSSELPDVSVRELFLVAQLKEHLGKVETMLNDETQEYQKLVEERSKHILSEDLHTGFDSTMINKKPSEGLGDGPSSSKTTIIQATEVLNPGSVAKPAEPENPEDVKASPDALKFGETKIGDYDAARAFLIQHSWIVNEREKDGLVMEAFEQELAGNTSTMEQLVHNALLIQYCSTLGRDGINMLFSRIANKTHPAREAFLKDVKFTVDHIKTRCQVLRSTKDAAAPGETEEEVEQIQLYSVDPTQEITVNVPPSDSEDPDTQEARRMFELLDPRLRSAAETRKLDEINKVLAGMSVPEAEEAVKHLDVSGVLSVEEKIYDATQWQEEKREKLAKGEFSEDLLKEAEQEKIESTDPKVPAVKAPSTIDEID